MVKGYDAQSVYNCLHDCGVEHALVSSLPAVFYRDVMEGNLELLSEIEVNREFFIPAAVLNPNYPGSDEDFARSIELGFKAIRLYPAYHGYNLSDECSIRIMRKAADVQIPVSLPASIENPLQRHRLDADRFIMEAELVEAVRAVPEATILFHHASTSLYAKALAEAKLDFLHNVFFDFQRVDFIAQPTMTQLFEYAGEDRVILGTGFPLHVPDVQLVKLANWSRFNESNLEKVVWSNLRNLIGI